MFLHETNPPEHYTAGAFVVRCFDNRFSETFTAFVKHAGLPHIDQESVAGGLKIFAAAPEDEARAKFMQSELEISIQLHQPRKVWLLSHTDCGAYGGLARFGGDKKKEFAFHTEEHRKAYETVRSLFPDLPIETFFIDEKGVRKIL